MLQDLEEKLSTLSAPEKAVTLIPFLMQEINDWKAGADKASASHKQDAALTCTRTAKVLEYCLDVIEDLTPGLTVRVLEKTGGLTISSYEERLLRHIYPRVWEIYERSCASTSVTQVATGNLGEAIRAVRGILGALFLPEEKKEELHVSAV